MGESPRASGGPEDVRPIPIVLFVDQVAEPFLHAPPRRDEERRDEMVTQLIRLAQIGRAAGIYLEASPTTTPAPDTPIDIPPPRARLGVPAPMAEAIAALL